jgi:hypothetical protein
MRHKTILDLFLVFRIPGQILCRKLLFINEPPYQEWHHTYECEGPPVRAERKRRANKVQQSTCVHRVAHQRIWPGRDDLLIFRDFDGRRRECILLPLSVVTAGDIFVAIGFYFIFLVYK